MYAPRLADPQYKLYTAIAVLALAQALLALWLLSHLGTAARGPVAAALALSLLIIGTLGWWLRRSLCLPLADAQALGLRMAQGDLAPHAVPPRDVLLTALQQGQDHVAAALARLRGGLDEITCEAGELACPHADPAGSAQRAAALRDQARALARLAGAFHLGPAYPAAGPALHLAASNRWRTSGAAAAAPPRLVNETDKQEGNWSAARVVQDSISIL